MSWSVHAQGKAPAVGKAIEAQFTDSPAMMDAVEEEQRQVARKIIAGWIARVGDSKAVVVGANGSASSNYVPPGSKEVVGKSYAYSISLQPLHGFVE